MYQKPSSLLKTPSCPFSDPPFRGRESCFVGVLNLFWWFERQQTIRILDLLLVHKDAATGNLLAFDYQGEELGAIVGALLEFEFEFEGDGDVFGMSIEPSYSKNRQYPLCWPREKAEGRFRQGMLQQAA